MNHYNKICFLTFFILITTTPFSFSMNESSTPSEIEALTAQGGGPQIEESAQEAAGTGRFGEYLKIDGFLALVSDYRWRGISLSNREPALQGQIFFRTKYGFYTSLWESYVNFLDFKGRRARSEINFIFGNANVLKGFSYDFGFLYNYYPKVSGENYGEGFFNIEYKIFAAGMAYTKNFFDLNKTAFYFFGDLVPELPIKLPFCNKGVTLLLHVGHYTLSGSLNRSSYFDFRIGLAKVFLKHIIFDVSFISTDGQFAFDKPNAGPTVVGSLTFTF